MRSPIERSPVRFRVLSELEQGAALKVEDIKEHRDFVLPVGELMRSPEMVCLFSAKDAFSIGFLAGFNIAQEGQVH